jgi:hypothetical protein
MKKAISKAALVSLALAALCSLAWVSAGGQTKDPEDFIAWIGNITGFAGQAKTRK